MNAETPLPRFKKPPVTEVVLGIQFQPVLSPVQIGLYYQTVKGGFPKANVQAASILPAFETFGEGVAMIPLPFPAFAAQTIGPRMWFMSADDNLLIQLQSDRLLFNWRGGLQGTAYPHFDAVQKEFTDALDKLDVLLAAEGKALAVNQCEVTYINLILTSHTGVTFSEPQKVFRVWSDQLGPEWCTPLEDVSFTARYRLTDAAGNPFGRLIAMLTAGLTGTQQSPAFQLELTARGLPQGEGREGIAAFHDKGHQAIVRYFASVTTPAMHTLWERYQ
jgi:uncharacterized protein (TIGR04255 family)